MRPLSSASQQSGNIVTLLEIITIVLIVVVVIMVAGAYIFYRSCGCHVLCLLRVVSLIFTTIM